MKKNELTDVLKESVELARDVGRVLKELSRRGVESVIAAPQVETEEPEAPAPVPAAELEVVIPPRDLGKEARLAHLEKQALACRRCRLEAGRKNVAFGTGNANARVIFIGEGPGAEEDRTGIPFVGRAGQLLNRMLASIGLRREDVYIANIVKCRPPGNRDPLPEEVAACRPYLEAQFDTIAPSIVVSLGRPSSQSLLNVKTSLSRLRTSLHKFRDTDLIVTYHPAYLLRNPVKKREAWADLMLLVDLLLKKKIIPDLPDAWWRT